MGKARVWRLLGVLLLFLGVARARRKPAESSQERTSPTPSVSWIAIPGGSCRLARSRVERVDGECQRVLFLHGLGGRLEHWLPIFGHLRASSSRGVNPDLAAIELPGHGESDALPEVLDSERVVAIVAAALNTLGWRTSVLVGHGSSAGFAVGFAAEQPKRVSGLILIDPAADQTQFPPDQQQRTLEAVREDPRAELSWHYRQLLVGAPARVRKQIEQDLQRTDPNSLAELTESAFTLESGRLSKNYAGPKTALVSSWNTSESSLSRLDAQLRVIQSPLGHWPMLEEPLAVARFLTNTLRRAGR